MPMTQRRCSAGQGRTSVERPGTTLSSRTPPLSGIRALTNMGPEIPSPGRDPEWKTYAPPGNRSAETYILEAWPCGQAPRRIELRRYVSFVGTTEEKTELWG